MKLTTVLTLLAFAATPVTLVTAQTYSDDIKVYNESLDLCRQQVDMQIMGEKEHASSLLEQSALEANRIHRIHDCAKGNLCQKKTDAFLKAGTLTPEYRKEAIQSCVRSPGPGTPA